MSVWIWAHTWAPSIDVTHRDRVKLTGFVAEKKSFHFLDVFPVLKKN